MSKRAEHIEHKGTVALIGRDFVRVNIEVNEACGLCASRKACAMGQSQTREITVATSEADSFSVGEVVKVGAKQRMGIMAVVLCYVVPLILLVTVLAVAIALGVAEGLAAVVSLCSLALYYGVVWLFRNQIAGRVSFTISKL